MLGGGCRVRAGGPSGVRARQECPRCRTATVTAIVAGMVTATVT
ncbi:hypothetical protein SV1_51 [Streptomyces phage SV1]|nr:hypothetical protein D280_gp51 [Streptomyces phage SV1]AFU62191.1 hypothetical protein SV1_51 [Streptomyces phage SV1]